MARLKRKSLPEQLAAAITKEISAGVWQEGLPGYRELGKRYDVGRRTCEGAVRILEANGVVGPSEVGKMRRILPMKLKKQSSEQLRLLIVIDRFHPPTPLDAELMMDVENFWKLEGGEVNRVAIDLMRTQKPDSQLKKWLKVPGADCLLFDTITPEWITPVEKLGLPCYAMGGSVGRGSGVLSGTGFKLAQHIGKVIRELVELEHQKILLVMGRATDKSMSQVVHEQAAQVIAKYEKTKKVSLSAIMPDFANPTDWQSYWQETLPKECPSVVITDSVYLGLSLHNFCLTRRIQMPRDLSMVVLDDAEFFTWLNPIPTRYRYRKEQAFRHFRRWVRSGFVPGTTKFFTTDFVKGQTLGKATHGLRLR